MGIWGQIDSVPLNNEETPATRRTSVGHAERSTCEPSAVTNPRDREKNRSSDNLAADADSVRTAEAKRCSRRRVPAGLRIMGVLYLLLGGLFIWLVVLAPGVINAGAPEYYYVPHACECLECLHGTRTAADGRTYCAKYPPKDILDAESSPSVAKARLIGGAVCGVIGFVFAITMPISGLLWLLRLWVPTRPRPWYVIMCGAAPLLVLSFWLAALCLKSVYPIPPM